MGLDWHSVVANEDENVPAWQSPCNVVGAPKVKDRPSFKQDISEHLKRRKADANEMAANNHPHTGYIEFWTKRTLEEEMNETADKFDCENCPLLKKLSGADSTGSFFIGVTVSSCDFRGKLVSADENISRDLRDRAYENMSPDEMLDYADDLERETRRIKKGEELLDIKRAIHWLRTCAEYGITKVTSY